MEILGYKEFINENIAINETEVKFFKEFTDILKSMKSLVAASILNLEGKDLKITFNYLNSTVKDDTLSFYNINVKEFKYEIIDPGHTYTSYSALFTYCGLPDQYHQSLPVGTLGNVKEKLTKNEIKSMPEGVIIYHFISDAGDHCMISSEGLKMVPAGTPQESSVGRLCRRLLSISGQEFSDKEIEEFVNEYKSKIAIKNNKFLLFELVSGEDIRYWYNQQQYDNDYESTLHNSCMRYDDCADYFDIYVENPEVCKLLILKSENKENKIVGRALVWTLADDTIFLDRVYYSEDAQVKLFHEYARKNGWCYKSAQNSNSHASVIFEPNKPYEKELIVHLKKSKFDSYPYIDTIKYLDKIDNTLSNRNTMTTLTLDDAEGGPASCSECNGQREIPCPNCDNGEIECPDCNNGRIECEYCNGHGEEECSTCDGTGKDGDDDCSNCGGTGEMECTHCNGQGDTRCQRCDTPGYIECPDCGGSGIIDCPECT